MSDNLPPLPSHPEHGWVWTEAEQRAIRAYAAAAVAAAVPPGWRVVPTQATAEMTSVFNECRRSDCQYADTYWEAMLDAAPEVPR